MFTQTGLTVYNEFYKDLNRHYLLKYNVFINMIYCTWTQSVSLTVFPN